ncbi:MAG: hypothetical protein P8Y94_17260, partial [Acidobacteriota bacterium]
METSIKTSSCGSTTAATRSKAEPHSTFRKYQDFAITATASDADGDSINVGWTFLQGAATTSPQYVNSPTTGSTIVSVLTFSGQPAGTVLRFRVSAWETANPSRSTSQDVTVTVSSSGTNPPNSDGVATSAQYGECTADAYGPPQISSGQYGGLAANPGDNVTTWVTLRDTSSVQDAWGNATTGPDPSQAQWDYSQLQGLGATGFSPVAELVAGDQASYKFKLSFKAPSTVSNDTTVDVFLTVPDRKGCNARVTFPITLYSGGGSTQQPTAAIKYNLGSGWQNRPANGVVANVPTRSIQLDGSGSVGVGTKTYA